MLRVVMAARGPDRISQVVFGWRREEGRRPGGKIRKRGGVGGREKLAGRANNDMVMIIRRRGRRSCRRGCLDRETPGHGTRAPRSRREKIKKKPNRRRAIRTAAGHRERNVIMIIVRTRSYANRTMTVRRWRGRRRYLQSVRTKIQNRRFDNIGCGLRHSSDTRNAYSRIITSRFERERDRETDGRMMRAANRGRLYTNILRARIIQCVARETDY